MAKVIDVRQSVVIEITDAEGKALNLILQDLEQECRGVTRSHRVDCNNALTSFKSIMKKYYCEIPF